MDARDAEARRLTLLYDETCRFCTALATWLARRSEGVVEAEPIGSPLGLQALRDVGPERRYDSIHVVDGIGRRRSGAEALPALFHGVPGLGWAGWFAQALPAVARTGYTFVAQHRRSISRLVPQNRRRPFRRASRGRAG